MNMWVINFRSWPFALQNMIELRDIYDKAELNFYWIDNYNYF